MYPLTRSTSRSRFFGLQQFTPAVLFAAGEQGAWYDPSDYSTLFQDVAGTTPVTGVEQYVRLMLDKSKGLVLGAELVVNGDFAVDADWNKNTGVTISAGLLTCDSSTITTVVSATAGANAVVGATYVVEFTVTNITNVSGGVSVRFGGVNGAAQTTTGTFREYIVATSTDRAEIRKRGASQFAGSIDNVSVKLLPGNHATAPNDPARPILRARYNRLTYTEDLSNGSFWSSQRATIAKTLDTLAPNGTATADKVTVTTNGYAYVQRSISATSSTLSCYFKAGTTSIVTLDTQGSSDADVTTFDLANQTASVGANNVAASITPVGNGWFHCSVSRGSASSVSIYIGKNNALTGETFYFWGADLRVTNDALNQPAYQRVAAATDYDTAGFLPYLEFNGSTWSMSTAAIDFSGTDKMTVFAGVRKYTATDGVMVEMSVNASSGSYPGSFFISNPTTARWYFLLRGAASIVTYEPQTYTAPITSLLTSSMDLSQSTIAQQLLPRVNGVLEQENSGGSNAGTGNFGNYPLFIGARNSTLFPFNGRLYSAIIRGAASSASEIAATEAWVNARTQAY